MIEKKLRYYQSQLRKIEEYKKNKRLSNIVTKHIEHPQFQKRLGSTIPVQLLSKHKPKTIFIFKGNNHEVVLKEFALQGCTNVVSKQSADIIWVQTSNQLPQVPTTCKLVNFVHNHQTLTNKEKMYRNIMKYNEGKGIIGNYLPETYIIDFKSDAEKGLCEFLTKHYASQSMRNKLIKLQQKNAIFQIINSHGQFNIPFKRIQVSSHPNSQQNIWILKPTSLNRGRGISLFSSIKQLKQLLSEDSLEVSVQMYSQSHTPSAYIIQQYIQKPLLIEGYKFDIRIWMLLIMDKRSKRLKCYMYQDGYVRLAGTKYQQLFESQQKDEDQKSPRKQSRAEKSNNRQNINKLISNRYMHLTNNAVQKYSKNYGILFQGNQMSLKQLEEYFKGIILLDTLLNQFRMIMMDTVNSVKHILTQQKKTSKTQHFQLFGYDFLIDQQIRPWLIEVNSNPCLEESSKLLAKIIPQMIKSLIDILHLSSNTSKQSEEHLQHSYKNIKQAEKQIIRSNSVKQSIQKKIQDIETKKQSLLLDNKWLRIL